MLNGSCSVFHVFIRVNLLKFTRQDVRLITLFSKRSAALYTAETLRVPVLIQSGDHFLNKNSE